MRVISVAHIVKYDLIFSISISMCLGEDTFFICFLLFLTILFLLETLKSLTKEAFFVKIRSFLTKTREKLANLVYNTQRELLRYFKPLNHYSFIP